MSLFHYSEIDSEEISEGYGLADDDLYADVRWPVAEEIESALAQYAAVA